MNSLNLKRDYLSSWLCSLRKNLRLGMIKKRTLSLGLSGLLESNVVTSLRVVMFPRLVKTVVASKVMEY